MTDSQTEKHPRQHVDGVGTLTRCFSLENGDKMERFVVDRHQVMRSQWISDPYPPSSLMSHLHLFLSLVSGFGTSAPWGTV